jgi:hypothetical protein
MREYPTKKLIQEAKAIIRLNHFLRNEVGLKVERTISQRLKDPSLCLKTAKKGLNSGWGRRIMDLHHKEVVMRLR